MGGLKLNDKLSYDGQVRKFGVARASVHKAFSLKFPELKGQRIPKWEDDRVWREHYEGGHKSIYLGISNGKENRKLLNSSEELRNACYEIIFKEIEEGYKNCSPNAGWCTDCLIGETWYGTPSNY